MSKYKVEDKLNVINTYLNGMESQMVARKFGIKSRNTVLCWVKSYKKYGLDGLKKSNKVIEYSTKEKQYILNWMKTTKSSYPETAYHFNIPSPSTIWTWEKRLEKKGIDGLLSRRERKAMTKKKTNKANSNNTNTDKEKLKKLEEENLMLRIENDFLKKLRALDDEEDQK
ncbi:transposase [Apilactobacillus kunkeei]|uniref:transposase n=1 Tax=Apilactobacillus kunkeei TaxID=148814 RepID=UPI00200ACBD9|nr:transposase [Apilactobacillus kunkeei]